MFRPLKAFVFLGAMLLTSQEAMASHNWAAVGGTCTPDESDVNTDATRDWVVWSATTEDGLVYIVPPAGSTSTRVVTVRCHVTNPMDDALPPPWDNWELTYQDTDGTATGSSVKMELIKVSNISPGSSATLLYNSNSSSITTLHTVNGIVPGSVIWDFVANYYFIKVTLTKATTAVTPKFYGAGFFE